MIDILLYVVYAVAVLLMGSAVLYLRTALFNRRPQKVGLTLSLLALPLYLIYYEDRWPFGELPMRELIGPLDNFAGADSQFQSDIAPAGLIGALLLVRMTVFQRVSVRKRLQRVHDPIANFFAGANFVILVSGILVSTFSWGWVGAVVLGTIATLVYLGALALLTAILEVIIEISKLISVWIKRKVFSLATRITRIASWVSSLGGRLVSRALIERIRADTSKQESIFLEEQEAQDRRLEEAYVRDRARRRLVRRGRLPEQAGQLSSENAQPQAGPLQTPDQPSS